MTLPFGRVAHPASPGPLQGPSAAKTTPGTSGPLGGVSSSSTDLQCSLESKLRARLEGHGSPLYALTWKHWDMPSGPPICALRARVLRTNGNGSSSWATPTANDKKNSAYSLDKGDKRKMRPKLLGQARMASGWPTPTQRDWKSGYASDKTRARGVGRPLNETVTYQLGVTRSGSAAPMGSNAHLNPAFVCWLMGYPDEWENCAPTETQLSPK